jgi:hypothetical protein
MLPGSQESSRFVKRWADFLALVKVCRSQDPEREIWFRGQANADYVLLPSLFRTLNGKTKEEEIYRKYRQIVHRIQPQKKGDWETLFDMQHNWIPTRLLDWSENLGIAVYFAVKYNDRKADMAIYLLDPLGLNRYSQKDAIPIIPDEPMGLDYVTQYLKKNPYPPQFPMAIRPNFSNDRMVAQRGLFTIHGDELTPIEQLCPRAITKVTVSKDVIDEANDFLEIANINEYTVFPDINGVSDYIRRMLD